MRTPLVLIVGTLLIGWTLRAGPAVGQTRENAVVESAAVVLDEIMSIPVRRIPQAMLADAQGVAIVPDVIKIGFIAGVRRGRGVVLVRDKTGAWEPPTFVTLTGGSVGWQAGVQATDVILVFKTRKSIEGLMRGKFTLGADAAAAAGPVGRQAEAATDARLRAEIYSYSRSRGLFAGVSLDGSALQIDAVANAIYYHASGVTPGATAAGPVALPASAARLMDRLARYTAGARAIPMVDLEPGPAGATGVRPVPSVRRQLAESAQRLHALLDEPWRQYLALPVEVFARNEPLPVEALQQSLARFDTVAGDPRYRALAERPEFQATHRLLSETIRLQTPGAAALPHLPPPPSESRPSVGPVLR